ncbi:glucosamine-6-phosphate deaminase [Paracoccus tegillarcae]|uniref:Glucosamine-6-phosphate deaminase n=1 Tax=Paracoccus tegillarcae TaxID=1529068 RepID=A0A2K9EN09_9RHOB|nr:glucosamine-6-phosphate deaminase [Paracoccus tegillarcae]AUH33025.1 glucosamine-6-phosphate deaminase [Paracoccus tegillarcae]
MDTEIHDDKQTMGRAAAKDGANAIRTAIERDGRASVIVATGASQFEMLDHLVREDIDWSKVTAFHLDEYVGLPESHPASFRGYLKSRFIDQVQDLGAFVAVNGDADDLQQEITRLNNRIAEETIAVCFAGVGENCHLAFNDPPADFDTETPYLVVDLDDACRQQQYGEGWFPTLDDVPMRAISMSVRQILKSREIILTIADARKADAVKAALEGPVTNLAPASILQTHGAVKVHLDQPAAQLLTSPGD